MPFIDLFDFSNAARSGSRRAFGRSRAAAFAVALCGFAPSAWAQDETAPDWVSASTDLLGGDIVLSYDEELDAANPPSPGDFVVTVDGAPVAVTSVGVESIRTTLNLASRVTAGAAVTVTYTDPTAGDDALAIQDLAGNDAADLALAAADVANIVGGTRISVPFDDGVVGRNGNNRSEPVWRILTGPLDATNDDEPVVEANPMGWSGLQFQQDSTALDTNGNPIFEAQGNDIPGYGLITDFNDVRHRIAGFIKWRETTGSIVRTMVFEASEEATLATDPSGAEWPFAEFTIGAGDYIGFGVQGRTPGISTDDDGSYTCDDGSGTVAFYEVCNTQALTGNAANSMVDELTAILAGLPRLVVNVGGGTVLEGDPPTTTPIGITIDLVDSTGAPATSTSEISVDYAAIADPAGANPATGGDITQAGVDFSNVSGSATIAPGESQATVTVTVAGDLLEESDETFILRLANSFNASISVRDGLVTIIDDDDNYFAVVEDDDN